jgi:hypothetical protein
MITATAYDHHVEQLFGRLLELHQMMTTAGISYRVVGGLAVYLHVAVKDPLAARLTRDIDAAVARTDLSRIVAAAQTFGWTYRHAAGVDMLIGPDESGARSAVHLIFLNEFVQQDYLEPVPDSTPTTSAEGFILASVSDLVRMKLTSYRLKDKVHIQDMDSVGLITPAVESTLSPALLARLTAVRAER